MKIFGVVVKDTESGKFFGFIKQFPGICAQGDTFEQVHVKVNAYFRKFIENMDKDVEMDESQIESI